MAAVGVTEWLEEKIAEAIHTAVGLTPFRGIVRQVTPDYRPEFGELLYGVRKYPFVAIASVQPEQFQSTVSSGVWNAVIRPVTVALLADKAPLENSATMAAYRLYREEAMRALFGNRFGGSITPATGSCVFQAIVRPRSAIEVSAWVNNAKWVSTFDVLVETREAP